MAGASLLTLLDDITSILDDVAAMSKIAAKKTSAVVGDDLALNAKALVGIDPAREIPIVLAVAKGSAINKSILIPAALAISAFVPFLIKPLLMLGGAYLCFEGVEKLLHPTDKKQDLAPDVDMVALERTKIKGAVRTDFILSAEVIVIALGTVAAAPFMTQVGVLTVVGVAMTIGVYGLVAGIVKMDDAGLHLSQKTGGGAYTHVQRVLGTGLLATAPKLMKILSVLGLAAMFAVGGEILVHGLPVIEQAIHAAAHTLSGAGAFIEGLARYLLAMGFGVTVGAVVVWGQGLALKLFRRRA